jgi:hypothetical protein
MQQGVLGEVNTATASQQIWNRKVHCRVHNSQAIVPVLNKKNPTKFLLP